MKFRLYTFRVFVDDWDKANAFYEDTLGLDVFFRNREMGWAEFQMENCNVGVELVAPDDDEKMAMVGRLVGVTLRVDDVHDYYETLSDKGVDFPTTPVDTGWGAIMAEFTDPFGNVIGILMDSD